MVKNKDAWAPFSMVSHCHSASHAQNDVLMIIGPDGLYRQESGYAGDANVSGQGICGALSGSIHRRHLLTMLCLCASLTAKLVNQFDISLAPAEDGKRLMEKTKDQ